MDNPQATDMSQESQGRESVSSSSWDGFEKDIEMIVP